MASVKRKGESSPSPSSSSTLQPKYDVFLSFRGEDTRNNFTDHLYVALKGKGIITFRDEEELKKGERISELFKAIEESQFAIIIFSRNYASSTWCLDELAKIIKCGLEVFPIFYNVSPSIVRKQTETFEQAFIVHQERFEDNIEKVKTWRDTLKKVADIKGWDLHLQNRPESEIIQDIVKVIMEKLSSKSSSINKDLIGIKSMVAELIPSYLGFGNDIYMMGICGMGGLGKTTLASAIHDEYCDHFEGSSFIANVRERSKKGELHELQHQLLDEILGGSDTRIYNVQKGVSKIERSGLGRKKVLLVLDDVNDEDQLKKLAGKHEWFGSGSWIIITTRDEHVLVQHGVLIYKPNGLDAIDASKLFCLKAFKMEQPKESYMQLSKDVLNYAKGLPLALVTLGSFLVGRTVKEWQSALDSFKNIKGDIYDILKISYDGLDEMSKEIFLDIVCFFKWRNKDEVIEILENCGLHARIGISVLVERSLLTLENGSECLMIHDLIQEMGKRIVRLKSGGSLGKQSRLWLNEDLLHVLKKNMGTEAIQAIVFCGRGENFNLEDFSEGFSNMSNLRFLRIDRVDSFNAQRHLTLPNNLVRCLWWINCRFKILAFSYLNAQRHLTLPNNLWWINCLFKFLASSYLNAQRHLTLPNNLRYLQWINCPFKCLASSHNQPMDLFVHLDLQHGQIEYLGEGVMLSKSLKYIDLSSSQNLIWTPDFSGVPNLEELKLSNCGRLVEIHPSIGQLSRLRYLDLYGCNNLTDLPCMSAVMESLKDLNLTFCFKISLFPKFTGIMKSLSKLNLSWTGIEKIEPSSIECLTALAFLDLSHCSRLECIPSNMDNLKSLETLDLSQCSKLKSLPRLPSNAICIKPEGFSYLNWSPEWVKLSIWSQPPSQWLPFDESGSPVGFTKLFHFLRGLVYRDAVLGGYIIQSWSAVKAGFSINIKLPSNWYNSEWIGFALWASLSIPRVVEVKGIRARVNHCAFEDSTTYTNGVCLLYLSREDWFGAVGNDECSQITVMFENKNSIFSFFDDCNDNSSYSSFENDNSSSSFFGYSSFENDDSSYSTVQIRGECGVSFIYKQGVVRVDELNKTNPPWFIESFGEVSIYKLTGGDDDVHIVNDDGVHKFRDDLHEFLEDDFDDADILNRVGDGNDRHHCKR